MVVEPRSRPALVVARRRAVGAHPKPLGSAAKYLAPPRQPREACGTSGMKVLVNGGLNLSELGGPAHSAGAGCGRQRRGHLSVPGPGHDYPARSRFYGPYAASIRVHCRAPRRRPDSVAAVRQHVPLHITHSYQLIFSRAAGPPPFSTSSCKHFPSLPGQQLLAKPPNN